jgi:4-amino-4-deoxy-L-arabinose transferase-like glycosyltransferase
MLILIPSAFLTSTCMLHNPFSLWLRTTLQDRSLVWALGWVTLAHISLAWVLHLSPDEAHYALYASKLDWSYFDHPPLVGWVQWLPLQLGGSDMLMRVVPIVCWLATAVALVYLADTVRPGVVVRGPLGLRLDVWLLLLSPLPHLLGLALVPDTLLMPLVCAIMLLCWHLRTPQGSQQLALWLALGLCLGLAGLAKYTAVLLALGVLIYLCAAHGPRLLAMRGPWLAAAVAAVCVAPVFYWNAQHDWMSFSYQLNHAHGANDWQLRKAVVFALLLCLAHGALLLAGLRWFKQHAQVWVLCSSFALPTLLALLWIGGRGSALPHWATPAFIAMVPMAALCLSELWQQRRSWAIAMGGLQALLCASLMALMALGGWQRETGLQASSSPSAPAPPGIANPFADLYGWDQAAHKAQSLAQRERLGSLAVMNWSLASRIAWYAKPLAVTVLDQRVDQFDLWFGAIKPQDSVLLVDWSLMSFKPPVGAQQFERCVLLDQMPVHHLGRQIAHFNFLSCHNWRGPAGIV